MASQFSGQAPLDAFLCALADDSRVQDAIRTEWPESAADILQYARAGTTQALIDSGAYDFLVDLIQNDSTVVKSIEALGASAPGEPDPFEIDILQFGPVFWVQAPQLDSLCYFSSAEAAAGAAEYEFDPYIAASRGAEDGEYEDDEDGADGESDDSDCPFCGSAESCEHHLLNVDMNWCSAGGGALYEKFTKAWAAHGDPDSESEDGESDEHEAFERFLEAVSALADEVREYEFEGGPGQSTTYRSFYCSTTERVATAVASFSL